MAAIFTRVPEGEDIWGKHRVKVFDITLDTSYPAAGYVINPNDVGMKYVFGGLEIGGNQASGKLLYTIDTKITLAGDYGGALALRCFFPSGGGAAAPTTLANAAIAAGATAVTSAAANGSTDVVPGVAVEVGTTTNLSTIVIRVMFFGA